MAVMGADRRLNVIKMLKIWMPLPDIHAMKHMKPTFLTEAVARAKRACVQWMLQDDVMGPMEPTVQCQDRSPPWDIGAWLATLTDCLRWSMPLSFFFRLRGKIV